MSQWENMYIQIYHQHGQLIDEQQTHDTNQLFSYAIPPYTMGNSTAQNELR
jgi:hypothetical protein